MLLLFVWFFFRFSSIILMHTLSHVSLTSQRLAINPSISSVRWTGIASLWGSLTNQKPPSTDRNAEAGHHTSVSGHSLDCKPYAHDALTNQMHRSIWWHSWHGAAFSLVSRTPLHPGVASVLWRTSLPVHISLCTYREAAEHLKDHGHPKVTGTPGRDIQPG